MNLTLLTATGDRPEAFALCEKFIARQTVKPSNWIVLDDGNVPTVCTMGQKYYRNLEWQGKGSLARKVRFALQNNLITGDALVFIEDDDWYAPQYLAWCSVGLAKYDLVGECHNLYYNVERRFWFEHGNTAHASLCATSLRRSVLPALLREVENEDPFIDSRLWANCRLSKLPFDPNKQNNKRRVTIGIKAMPGRKGYGEGHSPHAARAIQDPDLKKLRSLIGKDSEDYAKFYKTPEVTELPAKKNGLPYIEVHLVTYNEEMMLPYTLRHYKTLASRIIVHDGGSTDKTLEICAKEKVEVRNWDTGGKINDTLLKKLKETAWLGTPADWVIMADCDELIYFPEDVALTLESYETRAVAFVKPHGYEMVSDELPTTKGQIYEEVKKGAPDDKWYAKPIMFSPKRVVEINYMVGAHECQAMLKGGLGVRNPVRFSEPPCFLLHFHHIGSVQRIGAKYDANRARFSEDNLKNNWGNLEDGLKHARDKRSKITSALTQVIP